MKTTLLILNAIWMAVCLLFSVLPDGGLPWFLLAFTPATIYATAVALSRVSR